MAETPQVWSNENDTYTQQGEMLMEQVRDAVSKITGPLMAAGADASHMHALVSEAAQQAVGLGWQARQDRVC